MERMTCGNGGIGLGIALGLAEADSVQNLIERRLIYWTGKLRNPPESVRKVRKWIGHAPVHRPLAVNLRLSTAVWVSTG
jgi:hypothetical protein